MVGVGLLCGNCLLDGALQRSSMPGLISLPSHITIASWHAYVGDNDIDATATRTDARLQRMADAPNCRVMATVKGDLTLLQCSVFEIMMF